MKKLLLTMFLMGTFSLSYAQSDYYNDYRRVFQILTGRQ
jgi:hypothetical protein